MIQAVHLFQAGIALLVECVIDDVDVGSGEGDDLVLPAPHRQGGVRQKGPVEPVGALNAGADDPAVSGDVERYDPVRHPDRRDRGPRLRTLHDVTAEEHRVVVGLFEDIRGKIGDQIYDAAVPGGDGAGCVRGVAQLMGIDRDRIGLRHRLERLVHVDGEPIRVVMEDGLARMLAAHLVVVHETVLLVEEERSCVAAIRGVDMEIEADASIFVPVAQPHDLVDLVDRALFRGADHGHDGKDRYPPGDTAVDDGLEGGDVHAVVVAHRHGDEIFLADAEDVRRLGPRIVLRLGNEDLA